MVAGARVASTMGRHQQDHHRVNSVGRTIEVNTGNVTITFHVPAAARIVKDNALFVFKSLAVGDQLEKVLYYKSAEVNEALYVRVAD
jgi:hypothetical protein